MEDYSKNKTIWKRSLKKLEKLPYEVIIMIKKSYNYKIKSLNCEMQGYNNEVKSWNYQIVIIIRSKVRIMR